MPWKHQDTVERVLRENGIDPMSLICGLLFLLREQHVHSMWTDGAKFFQDGLDSLTSAHATTLAESISNWARVKSAVERHNGENEQKRGQEQNNEQMVQSGKIRVHVATTQKAMHEILHYLMQGWNLDGANTLDSRKRLEKQLAEQRGEKQTQDPPPYGDMPDEPRPR